LTETALNVVIAAALTATFPLMSSPPDLGIAGFPAFPPPCVLPSFLMSAVPYVTPAHSPDRISLQTQIDATPAGGTLVLSQDFNIEGFVRISKPINLDGNGHQISMYGVGSALSVFGSNTTIKNLWLDYESMHAVTEVGSPTEYTKSGVAIDVGYNTTNVTVTHCKFTGRFQASITITMPNTDNISFTHNTVDGGYYGVLVDNATGMGLMVADNKFTNLRCDAVCLNNPVYVHAQNFSNNWGLSSIRDGGLVMTNFTITRNEVTDCYSASDSSGLGIAVAGSKNGVITDNVISGVSYSGIHLEDNANNIEISGNRITNTKGFQPGRNESARWIGNSGAIWIHHSSNIRIIDNTIDQSTDAGIFLVWGDGTHNSDVTIYGNRISNSGDSIRAVGKRITIGRNYLDSPIAFFDTPFDPVTVTDSQAW
jgi:parallel beta-helix repeat protein